MIIIRLNGGLGNQMFQYAHGVALATKLSRKLVFDLTYLESGSPHGGFCLDQFCINNDIVIFKPKLFRRIAYRCLDASLWGGEWEYIREKKFGFQHLEFNQLSKKIILDGYWQSEKYFSEIRGQIHTEFTPLRNLSDSYAQRINEIKDCESVSLHIRRGDYLTNRKASVTHGVLPISYYKRAIDVILAGSPGATFFVFSDDPVWVLSELRREINQNMICVSDPCALQSSDLYLMSLCKHNIIANSSYSWWAAWLNKNKGKRVIAPDRWFNDSSIGVEDLLPSDWLTI